MLSPDLKVNVLLADDHPVFRKGLFETIRRFTFIENIYEATTGFEVMNCLNQRSVQVVYLDCNLPQMSGIDCLPRIRDQFPEIKVIVISLMDDVSTIMKMLNAGAHAYIIKNKDSAEIKEATRAVLKGERYFDEDVMYLVNMQLNNLSVQETVPHENLTDREREVLLYIVLGFTAKQISNKLHLSGATISYHRTSGMKKINAVSDMDIVRYYIKSGMISMEEFMGGGK